MAFIRFFYEGPGVILMVVGIIISIAWIIRQGQDKQQAELKNIRSNGKTDHLAMQKGSALKKISKKQTLIQRTSEAEGADHD